MKLSETTLETLKNFAEINQSMMIVPGKKQRTIAGESGIFAEAILEDDFPVKVPLHELPKFLGAISVLDKPDLDFKDTHVVMDGGDCQITYYYSSPLMVVAPSEKAKIEIKNVDVKFSVKSSAFQKLLKVSSGFDLENIIVRGKKGKLFLDTENRKDDTSNRGSVELGTYEGKDFQSVFSTKNFKMIPDNYNVKLTFAGFAMFENETGTRKYFIAMDKEKKRESKNDQDDE